MHAVMLITEQKGNLTQKNGVFLISILQSFKPAKSLNFLNPFDLDDVTMSS